MLPDSKLTILHTEASNGWGGQEIRILSEAEWFRDQGYRIILANPQNGQLNAKARARGFEVFDIPFEKKTQLRDFFRVCKLIQDHKPDVIGTHSSVDSWVGLLAASLCRVPCRLRYRHVSTPVHNNPFNRFQYSSLCDRIITTGECISGPLCESFHLSKEKVRTIFTGINVPSDLPDRNEARLALAQGLHLPSSSQFVGMVAVLRSWKGHAYLIDAFDQIADQFPEHHLILAGNGPQKHLQAQIDACKSKNRMHLIGHRENPWPVFRALDVAVLSSVKNEGIPQTGLQAMFAETPFIGTTVGGIPEIIENMKTGVLVAPSDATALADGLKTLLTDSNLRKEIASQALHFANSNATMDICGKAVECLITSVLKARNTF